MSADDEPEAPQAFDDSRRLPGPNRWYGSPAVELTALTTAAQDETALAAWAQRVRSLCAALHWPEAQPQAQRHGASATLAFAAPEDMLFTATEVNEWAWERAAAAHGALADEGVAPTQPDSDDLPAMAAHFGRRAADERSRPLARLKAAAAARGVPVFVDDDSVSLGAGTGSRGWPRAALPLPMDVPWAALHDVTTVLVTGSNGKTTVTRLLAAMAAAAGRVAGSCSTEGVVVAGRTVLAGDYAGPAGARAVLRHPAVQLAVLETARGGILRRGLAVRRVDAAVVTNVSADHLGEYGVHDVEDIARAKLVVARALVLAGRRDGPTGTLVLDGGDAVLMDVAARTPHVCALRDAGHLALFAPAHDHPALQALQATGGSTCGVHGGRLLWTHGGVQHDFGPVAHMPLTLGGAAGYNALNIAAAVLAAAAAGLSTDAVRHTLMNFGAQPQDNPGRLERWSHHGATVLVDYAHNPDGLAQLLGVARALQTQRQGRLGLLLGQAGNRDNGAIAALARTAAAAAPDYVVLKELPAMLRGRAPGEVPALLEATLRAAGVAPERIRHDGDEAGAARALLAWARPGDVVVLPVHTAAVRQALAQQLEAG
ncbi:MAG: Mur ligase family protein [Rubrivivax sp.]|nr:Mur ligase family protein [Rubrivivax sp.]